MINEISESISKASNTCSDTAEKILADLRAASVSQHTESSTASPETKSDSAAIPKLSLYDSSAAMQSGVSESLQVPHSRTPDSQCDSSLRLPVAGQRTDEKSEQRGASPEVTSEDNVHKLLSSLTKTVTLSPEIIRKVLSSRNESMALDPEQLRKLPGSQSEQMTVPEENLRLLFGSQRERRSLSPETLPLPVQPELNDDSKKHSEIPLLRDFSPIMPEIKIPDQIGWPDWYVREMQDKTKRLSPEAQKTIEEALKQVAEGATDYSHRLQRTIEDLLKQMRSDRDDKHSSFSDTVKAIPRKR